MNAWLFTAALLLPVTLILLAGWALRPGTGAPLTGPRPPGPATSCTRGAGLSHPSSANASRTAPEAAPRSEPAPAGEASTQARVRVHGRVLRRGHAVDGHELSFRPLDESGDDWDFSDHDGRYQVRVPPGRYAVRNDRSGAWTMDVQVPDGLQELNQDIHLPLGAISGRVLRHSAKESVEGVLVYAVCATASHELMREAGAVRSQADGSFELSDLPPGRYLMGVRGEEGFPLATAVVTLDSEVRGLELLTAR